MQQVQHILLRSIYLEQIKLWIFELGRLAIWIDIRASVQSNELRILGSTFSCALNFIFFFKVKFNQLYRKRSQQFKKDYSKKISTDQPRKTLEFEFLGYHSLTQPKFYHPFRGSSAYNTAFEKNTLKKKLRTSQETNLPELHDKSPLRLSNNHKKRNHNSIAPKNPVENLQNALQTSTPNSKFTKMRKSNQQRKPRTSDPFLKDRTAERTLTPIQRMAVKEVMKLKHRQTIKSGSPLALTLAAAPEEEEEETLGKPCPSPSPFLAIFLNSFPRNFVRAGNRSIVFWCSARPHSPS